MLVVGNYAAKSCTETGLRAGLLGGERGKVDGPNQAPLAEPVGFRLSYSSTVTYFTEPPSGAQIKPFHVDIVAPLRCNRSLKLGSAGGLVLNQVTHQAGAKRGAPGVLREGGRNWA